MRDSESRRSGAYYQLIVKSTRTDGDSYRSHGPVFQGFRAPVRAATDDRAPRGRSPRGSSVGVRGDRDLLVAGIRSCPAQRRDGVGEDHQNARQPDRLRPAVDAAEVQRPTVRPSASPTSVDLRRRAPARTLGAGIPSWRRTARSASPTGRRLIGHDPAVLDAQPAAAASIPGGTHPGGRQRASGSRAGARPARPRGAGRAR